MKRPGLRNFIILIFAIASTLHCAAQTHSRGLDFNDAAYALVPKKAQLTRALDTVPSSASIKNYAPYPKTQGAYGTCTAWACAYCALTMLDAIKNNCTDRDSITAKAYSPAFLFRLLNPNDEVCAGGTDMQLALQMLKSKGGIRYQELTAPCIPAVNSEQIAKASGSRLKDFARLFDTYSSWNIKIQAVKKAIAEKKPVTIGMLCPPSLDHAYHDWQPTEEPLSSYGGHAMCVVSYDDNQYGGAFEIQNSWGDNWGFEGYTWVRYNDFARFVRYGYELIDLPDAKPGIPDLSGSIKLMLSTNQQMPVNLLVSTRGLKVVAAKKTPEPITIYQTASAYPSGTKFRIYLSNDQPAYVYAISLDDKNNPFKVFPDNDKTSAALTYQKNDVALPGEESFIAFDEVPGKDFLCVLYSRNELNINDIMTKVNAAEGSFNQKIFKAVGSQMVDPADIEFVNDRIAFRGVSKGKDLVAMMVELDHK